MGIISPISDKAFANCSLKSITIPASVGEISDDAFSVIADPFAGGNTVGTLKKAIFLGNAPGSMASGVFGGAAEGFIISYDAGKNGFTSPRWKGYSTTAVDVEIAVQQPLGTNLVDGATEKSFGSVKVGESGRIKTFIVKNKGSGTIPGLGMTLRGPDAHSFHVTGVSGKSLGGGESTKFKVVFQPVAKGTRNAVLRIKSSDLSETPFDIELTGMGMTPKGAGAEGSSPN